MIDSVNRLTGTKACTEAVLVQERPKWAPYVLMAAVAVIAVVLALIDPFNGSSIWLGAIIGCVVGLMFTALTTYWIIARVGDEVLLARSSKMSAKAVEIVERHPVPVSIDIGKGLIQSKVVLNGRKMFAARQFVSRIKTAVS